jgi:acyl carrier protein
MTHDALVALVRRHLDDIVPGQAESLSLDDDVRDELDLDSMDVLKLVRALHEELDVDIPDTKVGSLRTLRAFAAYLEGRLG